jgi:hypothetical protein
MARKKILRPEENPGPINDWEVSFEIQVNGRKVVPGTELKIAGERGRFRFIKHVVSSTTEWIDVWGGTKYAPSWRSFTLDKVKRVHYKNTTDQALAAEYKAKKLSIKQENIDTIDGS